MNALKHIYQQPFIFATGIAALIHSTWALGTLFNGHAPTVDWWAWEWYEWIVPSLLIAFALDVGQISTSSQIRSRGLTWARGFTFLIFAIATYYLQWLYMAVHMPLLDISEGVTGIHYGAAESLRNLAIWLIPALLPISTVSYTFSGDQVQHVAGHVDCEAPEINIKPLDDDMELLPVVEDMLLPEPTYSAHCDECGWHRDGYTSQLNADKAIKMHKKHCVGVEVDA